MSTAKIRQGGIQGNRLLVFDESADLAMAFPEDGQIRNDEKILRKKCDREKEDEEKKLLTIHNKLLYNL